MKILITGANGQLGLSLLSSPAGTDGFEWLATDYPGLDITDPSAVNRWVRIHHPAAIVNCAAYTEVDQAEKEPEKVRLVNAVGPGILALAAKNERIPFIHISTDYVFSGKHWLPYRESDLPDPASVYGKSKLEGEESVKKAGGTSVIIRTSWLYSEFGRNFFLTLLRLGLEKETVSVVMDQIGCPTYAGDLASAIIILLGGLTEKPDMHGKVSIFHFCNSGVASWYDFACEIMTVSGLTCKVIPVRTEQYPLPAPRPFYSVLDTSGFRNAFGISIPHWKESLQECYKKYLDKNKI